MPVRTIPIDPQAPVPAPETDSLGRPRWAMPLDRMVFWIICALEIGSVFMLLGIFVATKQPALAYAVAIPALLLAPALFLAARLTITLDEDRLRWVFFPFWRSSVPYDSIENVEICTFDAMRDFGGWGPKLGRGGHFGAIAASGKGVLITRTDKKRKLVLSCAEPESLALELLRRVVPEEPDESV